MESRGVAGAGGGPLEEAFARRFAGSAGLYERARGLFPSGVTHDARFLEPFPIYVERARGAYKWDVDGNQLIDYWMGHGALLLGHAHPVVVEAVERQVRQGTHYGACHRLEIEWAEAVRRLMPAAETIRFTSSGTEATHLAMRLARAYTGKSRIVKFEGHFHGWHDYAIPGAKAPFDRRQSPGIPEQTLEATIVLPPNDVAAAEQVLRARDDVAAVIVEPSGGSWGEFPVRPDFLHELAELTRRHGVLFILDEVVTGFRMAPGGAQEVYGLRPDLICLAKILCGGLPGGAVAGRREILDRLAYTGDPARDAVEKIPHQGTFNANPLSAAAGIAVLQEVAGGRVTARAAELARELVERLNEAIARRGVRGCAYGESSWFHVAFGIDGRRDAGGRWWPVGDHRELARAVNMATVHRLRRAMLVHGVDLMRNGGFVSAVHSQDDIEVTAQAFDKALQGLVAEGAVPVR